MSWEPQRLRRLQWNWIANCPGCGMRLEWPMEDCENRKKLEAENKRLRQYCKEAADWFDTYAPNEIRLSDKLREAGGGQ